MVGVLPNHKDKGVMNASPIKRTAIPNANERKKPVDAIRCALSWRCAPNSLEI